MKTDELIRKEATVTANLLTWLGVHGNLCLALRHPANRGASRPFIVAFTKRLGKMLVELEVVTQQQLEAAERVE